MKSESITIEDDNFIDLDDAERHIWLMKSPNVVTKLWEKQTLSSSSSSSSSYLSSPSPPLAKVVHSVDLIQVVHEFSMDMYGAEYMNTPKCYTMNMFNDFVPMEAFSHVNLANHALEGEVKEKFDMKPRGRNIEEYSRLCRERTNRSMVKNRQIQVIDNDRGVHMRPMPGMYGLVSSNSKDKKRPIPVKQTELKRTRRDRGEMEAIMFKLFEGQSNWTLKQLVNETAQPAQFLKEILNDLCVYNKRGSNQGTYELKPEYKKAAAEDDSNGQ